jgi:hypothetical protein
MLQSTRSASERLHKLLGTLLARSVVASQYINNPRALPSNGTATASFPRFARPLIWACAVDRCELTLACAFIYIPDNSSALPLQVCSPLTLVIERPQLILHQTRHRSIVSRVHYNRPTPRHSHDALRWRLAFPLWSATIASLENQGSRACVPRGSSSGFL